jgi:hypothetical protein
MKSNNGIQKVISIIMNLEKYNKWIKKQSSPCNRPWRPIGFEMLRISHLTYGGKFVNLTHPAAA